jgi:hypothetical protein
MPAGIPAGDPPRHRGRAADQGEVELGAALAHEVLVVPAVEEHAALADRLQAGLLLGQGDRNAAYPWSRGALYACEVVCT